MHALCRQFLFSNFYTQSTRFAQGLDYMEIAQWAWNYYHIVFGGTSLTIYRRNKFNKREIVYVTGRTEQFLATLCELSANQLVILTVVVGGHMSSSVTEPLTQVSVANGLENCYQVSHCFPQSFDIIPTGLSQMAHKYTYLPCFTAGKIKQTYTLSHANW